MSHCKRLQKPSIVNFVSPTDMPGEGHDSPCVLEKPRGGDQDSDSDTIMHSHTCSHTTSIKKMKKWFRGAYPEGLRQYYQTDPVLEPMAFQAERQAPQEHVLNTTSHLST